APAPPRQRRQRAKKTGGASNAACPQVYQHRVTRGFPPNRSIGGEINAADETVNAFAVASWPDAKRVGGAIAAPPAGLLVFRIGLLEGRTQNVAERGTRIGGAVLSNGFLFFRDFQRLDRKLDLAGGAIELRHAGIDLVADSETLGALVATVAGQFRTADEGGHIVFANRHLKAVLGHGSHRAGNDRTLADVAERFHRVATKLLDAERDALLLRVNVEHDRFHDLALLVVGHGLFAGPVPVEIGHMHHAVHIGVEADEETELGDVLDLAFDDRAGRETLGKGRPGIVHAVLEAERDTALHRIHFENHHFHFLRGGNDLARMHVLLRPAHFGNMDETFHTRLQLHEGTVIGDVRHAALEAGFERVLRFDAFPRIGFELLHAERDALRLV